MWAVAGMVPFRRPREYPMTPLFRKILGLNWVLLLTMYGLLVFGVFAIESAARHLPGGGEFYAGRQRMWILVGSAVYVAASLMDYRWIRWLGIPLYVAGLGLMAKAMVDGSDVHQISVGGSVSFQPSQIGIAAGIVLISSLLQDLGRLHRWLRLPWFKIGLIGILSGIPFLMVVKMNDMGSAIVWLPVALVMVIIAGVPYRHLMFLGLIAIGLVAPLYFIALPQFSERGTQRIHLYLDMLNQREVDISGDAYGPYYVSMAVGKAGWTGVGWMATAARGSLHDKGFISKLTAHNDYIFAVIAEEQGFRGSLLLVTSFALLLVTCLFVAVYARDMSGRVLVAGVVALFFAHIFENIGMCVLLTPVTGIPLPLVSYSGTFVVMCMFLLGLVQSVWVHRNAGQEEEGGEGASA